MGKCLYSNFWTRRIFNFSTLSIVTIQSLKITEWDLSFSVIILLWQGGFCKILARSQDLFFSNFVQKLVLLDTLVETAGTFYMLQACMQGNFLKNLENSPARRKKSLRKFPASWKILPASHCALKKSPCNFEKSVSNLQESSTGKNSWKLLALLTESYSKC